MGYKSYIAFRGNDFDDAREIVECIRDKADELLEHFDKAESEMEDEEGYRDGYRGGYRKNFYDGNRDYDGYRGYRRRGSNGRYR